MVSKCGQTGTGLRWRGYDRLHWRQATEYHSKPMRSDSEMVTPWASSGPCWCGTKRQLSGHTAPSFKALQMGVLRHRAVTGLAAGQRQGPGGPRALIIRHSWSLSSCQGRGMFSHLHPGAPGRCGCQLDRVFWSQPSFEGRTCTVRGRANSLFLQSFPTSPSTIGA